MLCFRACRLGWGSAKPAVALEFDRRRISIVAALLGSWLLSLPPSLAAEPCLDDQWSAVYSAGAPTPRRDAVGLALEGQLFVWGGTAGGVRLNDGGLYDPRTGRWQQLQAPLGLPPRDQAAFVSDGHFLYLFGGKSQNGELADLWRFDPLRARWTLLANAAPISPRAGASLAISPTELLIFGGEDKTGLRGNGARFDLETQRWKPLNATSAPAARRDAALIWSGDEWILIGGKGESGDLSDGARLDPQAGRWTPLPLEGSPSKRHGAALAWTGTELLVWGGTNDIDELGDGAAFDLKQNRWRPLRSDGAPTARHGASATWSGTDLLIWGGTAGLADLSDGARYDPSADRWRPIGQLGAPTPRLGHVAAWTGAQLLIWGGGLTPRNGEKADGGIYCSAPLAPLALDDNCNGIDDDGDGSIDEDYQPHPTSCGLGACAASGVTSCVAGQEFDSCTPGVPGLERCNGIDDDCDGTVDQITGTRYVAPGGIDSGNLCVNPNAPCAGISYAASVACDNETVSVAEGGYLEDVVLDHPIRIDAAGIPTQTLLTGTGATDLVRIRSGHVIWDGVDLNPTPGSHACIHIGDAAHLGLRGVEIYNTAHVSCGTIGEWWENTGFDPAADWNRVAESTIRDLPADGSANGGTGVLLTGGNGRLSLIGVHIRDNGGSGIKVTAGQAGRTNERLLIVGNPILRNGRDPSAQGHAAIELHSAKTLLLEGNDIFDHDGSGSGDDGRGLVLDSVDGSDIFCNEFSGNDTAIEIKGTTANFDIRHDRIVDSRFQGLSIGTGTAASNQIHETIFRGNSIAVKNSDVAAFNATHNWWGGSGAPLTSGVDSVSGNVNSGNFLARTLEPVLARQPEHTGWNPPLGACWDTLQGAIDAATDGGLILVGAGQLKGSAVLEKKVDLEGSTTAAIAGCPSAEIDGTQSGGSHLPALRIRNVDGISIKNIWIRNAGKGTICGQAQGDEIGLDLQNVDNSFFKDLCVKENGVTEVRVYGDSDNNRFENVQIDGMIRDDDTHRRDVCGHRSREGLLIDGGPVCEGGPGASADNNVFSGSFIKFVTRGVSIRYGNNNRVENATLEGQPAARFDNGNYAAAAYIGPSNGTTLSGNTIGNQAAYDAIRVFGRSATMCGTEMTDANGVTLQNNTIQRSGVAGLYLFHAASDPGTITGLSARCNDITGNGTGVRVQAAAGNTISFNDVRANGAGVQNQSVPLLSAEHVYWGASNGPSGGGGSGNSVSGAVDYTPFTPTSVRDDADGDGFTECAGDNDDTNSAIHPGPDLCDGLDNDGDGSIDEDYVSTATSCGIGQCGSTGLLQCIGGTVVNSCTPGSPTVEQCDGLDNNCDGVVDNAQPPTGIPALSLSSLGATTAIAWVSVPSATGYDLVRGDLSALTGSGGDFSGSADRCLDGEFNSATSALDTEMPGTGGGFWYLLRAENCGGSGTYDEPSGGQAGLRDAEIAASSGACP